MKRAALVSDGVLPALSGVDRVIPQWPGEAVRLDGSTTFMRHTPPRTEGAEPALYVHGLGGSSLNWTDLGYLLADRLDAHAIDLPGFGFSDPARRYTIPAMADRGHPRVRGVGPGPGPLFRKFYGRA